MHSAKICEELWNIHKKCLTSTNLIIIEGWNVSDAMRHIQSDTMILTFSTRRHLFFIIIVINIIIIILEVVKHRSVRELIFFAHKQCSNLVWKTQIYIGRNAMWFVLILSENWIKPNNHISFMSPHFLLSLALSEVSTSTWCKIIIPLVDNASAKTLSN